MYLIMRTMLLNIRVQESLRMPRSLIILKMCNNYCYTHTHTVTYNYSA